jgi:4-aminobutyrate aminotransferase-like enzyme
MTEAITKKLAALQAELDNLRKEVREIPVGQAYEKPLSRASTAALLKEAASYEDWLAKKTRSQGTGAACDSGEAKICAILREFIRRFSE